MSGKDELIQYKDHDRMPIRIAHAVQSIAPVPQIETTLEETDVVNAEERIESQIRKRKQIMHGLDEEIHKLEQLLDEEGENE